MFGVPDIDGVLIVGIRQRGNKHGKLVAGCSMLEHRHRISWAGDGCEIGLKLRNGKVDGAIWGSRM